MAFEYRKDGWPLCPRCGEDELMSQYATRAFADTLEQKARMLLRATPVDPMLCLQCRWTGFVPPVAVESRERLELAANGLPNPGVNDTVIVRRADLRAVLLILRGPTS